MGKSKLFLVVYVHPRSYLQNKTDFALLCVSKKGMQKKNLEN